MADDCLNKKKKNVAIIGLGLLGASLGMALRGREYHRIGWNRRAGVNAWALEHDVVDEAFDRVEDAIAGADITVLCLPIPMIKDFIAGYADCWRPGSIVTDIGSVKQVIVEQGEKYLEPRNVHFVGSHPMAGTEKSGCEAAFPALYDNAEAFVTRTGGTNGDAFTEVRRLWESIGVRVVELAPEAHDVLVAHTSHMLHVVALALAQAVLDCPDEHDRQLRFSGCATGFRDTSRIASSSPRMWREIIENNREAALTTIESFENRLSHLRKMIAAGDFDGFEQEFAHGKELRDGWVAYKAAKSKKQM
jgi:prephenate dehydrogenase